MLPQTLNNGVRFELYLLNLFPKSPVATRPFANTTRWTNKRTASSLTDRDIPDIVVGLMAAIRYIFTCSRMRLVTEGCLQESRGNCEQLFWREEKIGRPLCTDAHLSN